jgi:hypothetical protein
MKNCSLNKKIGIFFNELQITKLGAAKVRLTKPKLVMIIILIISQNHILAEQ